jgi:hypothetical protein
MERSGRGPVGYSPEQSFQTDSFSGVTPQDQATLIRAGLSYVRHDLIPELATETDTKTEDSQPLDENGLPHDIDLADLKKFGVGLTRGTTEAGTAFEIHMVSRDYGHGEVEYRSAQVIVNKDGTAHLMTKKGGGRLGLYPRLEITLVQAY